MIYRLGVHHHTPRSAPPVQITVFPGGEETPKVSRVISKARWGKDPNTVLTGSADGFVRVWDVRSGEKIRKVQVAGAVMDLEMSWDKKIATVAAGDTVHFFDTGGGWGGLLRSCACVCVLLLCIDPAT